jgi:hypothetical protein
MRQKKSKNGTIGVIIIVIILGVAAIIAGVFGVRTRESRNEPDVMRQTEPGNSLIADDSRTLLTIKPDTLSFNPTGVVGCEEVFSAAAPTTTVRYESAKYGVAFDVPYNPDWGSEKYRVSPFDEVPDADVLVFGPVKTGEACGWGRAYLLSFQPQRSAEDALSAGENPQVSTMYSSKPKKDSVGGLTVVESEIVGLCSMPALEVIGTGDYNYSLQINCGEETEKDFTFLESIVKTFELTR